LIQASRCPREARQRARTFAASRAAQVYNLVQGDIELQAELERPAAFKCGSFGGTTLEERHLATGDFVGNMQTWDLERLQTPVYTAKGARRPPGSVRCAQGAGFAPTRPYTRA
jgi:hypothetical protein